MTDDISPQEQAVLALVRANPLAGQQQIADALGLARSTVAVHIANLTKKGHILGRGYLLPEAARIVAIGGAVMDRKYHAAGDLVPGTSNPVTGSRSYGGVARNVAENLALLGTRTGFVSIVGDDDAGRGLLRHLGERGVDTSQVILTGVRPTAEYAAILDPAGNLSLGIADMAIFDLLTPASLDRVWSHLAGAAWVFADCNLPEATLHALIERAGPARFRLAVDAVSTPKVARLPRDLSGIDLLFMNCDEAAAFLGRPFGTGSESAKGAARALVTAGAGSGIVSAGAEGVAIAGAPGDFAFSSVPASLVDVTGAGDAMIAGTLHYLLAGRNVMEAARLGTLIAGLTTESDAGVRADLSEALVQENAHRLI